MDKNSGFIERYLTPIAVLLGAVILALAYVFAHNGAPAATGTTPTATAVDIKNVKTDGEPFIGSASAPVTIAFFYDYQCPFCKQFEQMVSPALLTKYVDTGKVKIVLKDFPFLGDDSITDAEYGHAVWDLYPAQFQAWYMAMFNAQDDEGDQGFGDEASVKALTATISGIDADKVAAQVASKKAEYDAAIKADFAEGQALGVNGTPTVIVGTKLLSGLSPADFTSQISAEIDAELK